MSVRLCREARGGVFRPVMGLGVVSVAALVVVSLFACGAALAQSPSQIPVGAGTHVTRQPAGSRFRSPTNPPPAVVAPVPVKAPFSWTGVYVGGDFGGSFASNSITSATTGWTSQNLNPAAVMGGAYAGYNYQVSPNFVLGLEADFQGNHSSATFYYPTFDVAPNVQQNWVASLNGRLGIAYDRALFYAIGGAAQAQGSVTATPGIRLFPPTLQPVSRTANLSGWDVGAGVEYAFDPGWLARLEYRYYDFGSFNATNVGAYQPLHVQSSVNTVRVGLAYLFGAPAPVVVTKAAPVATGAAAPVATGAPAGEYHIGDVVLTVSGAATVGTEVRTAQRNARLIFAPNGQKLGVPATATSGANQDDGNLNYAPGSPVSSVAKAFATVDARYQNYGVLFTGKVWGDFTQLYADVPWGNYPNGYTPNTPLGQAGFGSRQQFAGATVQQAYAYTRQTIGGATLDGRIGEINVPWGLQTAIPGGLAFAVNAFDYAAIVRPGAQALEALIPTPGVFTRWSFLQNKATLDAFFLFEGPQSQLPGCGTFFSGADWLPPGCNNVFFNPAFNDPTSFATDFALNKIGAPVAHDANFGVGGSYQADALRTKFGLYYAHVDQPTPVGEGVKTLRTVLVNPFGFFAPGNPGNLNPGYTVAYLGAVDTYTFNFTTQIDRTSFYGEYTFSPNKPVNFNAADIVFALIGPNTPTVLRGIANATPLGGIMPGVDRLQAGNLDLGVRQIIPSVFNASALTLNAEFALKQVYNLPSDLRFGRSEVFGQGPVAGFPCGAGDTPQQLAVQCTQAGYVTSSAYGVRGNAALTYANVFIPGLNLTPSIGLIWDISGWSYDGIFNQGRVAMPLKIRADYGKNYFAEISWVPTLIYATYDNLSDRQFVSFAAGVTW